MPKFNLLSLGSLLSALLLIVSLALVGPAQARMGGSFGSRGMRTFSSPSITSLAPNSVSPIQRSMTPNSGTYSNPGNGGYGNAHGAWLAPSKRRTARRFW